MMADRGIAQGRHRLEVQVVEAEFLIENFAAACVASKATSNTKPGFRELASGPIISAQTIPFGIGFVWGMKDAELPDPAKEVGCFIQSHAETLPKGLCYRLGLSIINRNPLRSLHKRGDDFLVWKSRAIGWSPSFGDGKNHFQIKLADLLDVSQGWLHNEALIIRCKFEFVPKDTIPRTSSTKVQNGQPALCNSFKDLLTSGRMSDVVIVVSGERLNAHSVILGARSQVFNTMLSSPMKEGLEKEVTIPDVSVDVMKGLLEYLYTGNIEKPLDDDDFSSGLLRAAHRFELKELLQECEQIMVSQISASNAVCWFELADVLSCQELRAACLRCIRQHLSAIQGTEGYEQLVERRPALLKDIIAAVAPPPAKRQRTEA